MNELEARTPQRPLIWPDTVLDICERLVIDGVYIVGGAVRDAYLHRPIKDLDLALAGDSIRFARHLANEFRGDIFVMDRERGVARVLLNTPDGLLVVDVARFRGHGLLADLRDRDFTLNAMAVAVQDPERLIDPLHAERDIAQKLLRQCHADSIATDPIRALRAVRQSVQFNFRIEPETLTAVRQHGSRLRETSEERVRDEFYSLLSLKKTPAALRVADAVGLLQVILPELEPLHGLAQSPPHQFDVWQHTLLTVEKLARIIEAVSPSRTDNTVAAFDLAMLVIQLDRYRSYLHTHLAQTWPNERPHQTLLALAALLHNIGKPGEAYVERSVKKAAACAARLRLSSDEIQRLTTIIHNYRRVLDTNDWTPLTLHRFWYSLKEAGIDVCLLALADHLATVGTYLEQDAWLMLVERVLKLLAAYFDQYATIVEPPALVNGNQLMEHLDLPPGPLIGKLLQAIREAQVTGEVTTAEEAFALAEKQL
jgi:tRNA nucleotidyltransferase/poly(A) polymerase